MVCNVIFKTSQSSFVSTHLIGFKYSHPTLIILFNINPLFAQSKNGFKYCYLTLVILFIMYSYPKQITYTQLYVCMHA